MVGVPGRSKGCKTCRRRKIRCDLREPQCGQCIKSGRHCEGFEKETAFIHRTLQGILRKGQEQSQRPAPWEMLTAGDEARPSVTSTVMSQMPPQANNAAIYIDGMLATFLVTYLPSSSVLPPTHLFNITVPAPWMQVAIALPRRGPLLSVALQALCMTKIARVNGDTALLMQGMTVHGKALRAMQTALRNTNTLLADETLAAMRVLGTYELYEGTMGSVVGWTSHEEGVDQLMIRGVQFFKATFFGEERWCIMPWGDNPKDHIQQLYDIGLLVPSILEELHGIQKLPNDPCLLQRTTQILQRCQHLDDRFNAWHARLLTCFATPPYWEQPAELISRAADIPTGFFVTSFDFLNIRIADGLAVFWALRTILHVILRGLSSGHNPVLEENDLVIVTCACNITKSIPYFTRPETGYLGVQWTIFPLKVALSAFQQVGWESEREWIKAVLTAVKARGIRYGGDIVEAQWGEQIR
ncbi:hypothetical protein N7513_003602 [Penicillium frequentans]|nr:hypothetical protein N7513_003602 [Penicillium glabrum]